MMFVPIDYAKKQRDNLQASTDRLDLMGIAKTVLNRRGNCSPAQSGIYLNLRNLVRHRRKLVSLMTELRNRILKDYLVQSASHLGLHGPPELMMDYKRRDASGQHADFGMARRYLRMAMCLMRNSQVYLPGDLRTKDSDSKQRAEYYMKMWPSLRGKWRNMVQDFYEIKLSL